MLLSKTFRFNRLLSNKFISKRYFGWSQPAILAYGVPFQDDDMEKLKKHVVDSKETDFYQYRLQLKEETDQKLEEKLDRKEQFNILYDPYKPDEYDKSWKEFLLTTSNIHKRETGYLVNSLLVGPINEEYLKKFPFKKDGCINFVADLFYETQIDPTKKPELDDKAIRELLKLIGVDLKSKACEFNNEPSIDLTNKKMEDLIGYYALFIG